MPTTRRRRRRPPLPKDYQGIPLSEQLRWIGGWVLIEGEFEVVKGEAPPLAWPDWSTWASTYERCRDDFLAGLRHSDRVPGAEALYEAYQAGGDDGAAAAEAELRQREIENDPRRLLLA